jgi:hypothetical protein
MCGARFIVSTNASVALPTLAIWRAVRFFEKRNIS